jgi:hypothetical protein
MVLPSSLREEEDELLSIGILNNQPLARAPCSTSILDSFKEGSLISLKFV